MLYNVKLNGKLYEVEVVEVQAGQLSTETPVEPAPVHPSPDDPVSDPSAVPAGTQTAPMPGTVLAIRVNVGQAVEEGDLLFILEAMKMENEIFAGTSGVVRKIYVGKGSVVNTGSPLVLIE
jgi:biotin carboxyl carrier protein